MGFDLFGVRSVSYFRNNVWWWRPLASYVVACCEIQEEGWFDNRGLEVSARKALQVADTRSALLKAGAVEAYEKQYRERLDALPEEQCRSA